MGEVKCCSLNVRGLNSPGKRGRLRLFLKQERIHIALLQETHLKKLDTRYLYCQGFNAIYQASHNSKKAGVAVMLAESLNFVEKGKLTDGQGRYMFVKGTLDGKMVTIGSVYVPNTGQNDFILNMLKKLKSFMEGSVILGGDLNLVFDTHLDRSANVTSTGGLISNAVKNVLKEEGIVDLWRLLHPAEKDYTFFSHVHRSSSRIDYFLTHGSLLKVTKKCEIGTITFSDHAPVFWVLNLGQKKEGSSNWRLNDFLMRDPIKIEETKEILKHYWSENDTGEVSKEYVWEGCKATLRGHFMTQMGKINRDRKKYIEEITKELQLKHEKYKETGTLKDLREWNGAKTKFNMLMADKVEMQLTKIKQRYFEFGDKPSRLLARRLKAKIEKSYIATIKDTNGVRFQKEREKQELFRVFYQKLYKSQGLNLEDVEQYLAKNPMPKIGEEEKEMLEQDISLEEVKAAIKDLKLGKSPGPDGITGLFYKKLVAILAPHLTALFNSFGETGVITQTMQDAVITLIPKPGKDHEECGSYRPISLLNIDAKLYTKILANRIQGSLPRIIHPDQTGFITGRNTFDNTRKIVHLLEKAKRSKEQACLISLDAEKAFDRVEWGLIQTVLKHIGLGPKIRKMIGANYTYPKATIRINGEKTPSFHLTRGTRQGCPLSPLLFALSLEPLAIAIRNNPKIEGIKIGGIQHKISLFADDIILSLTSPKESIQETMKELESYSNVSGFKINYDKSEALNLTMSGEELGEVKKLSPLKWAKHSIKYLGVQITADPTQLYEANFPPILKVIKKDLAEWGHITNSWIGRISIVKMNILPRLLYIFQALPMEIHQRNLNSLQQLLMKFIWNGKKPRIRKQILYRPRIKGGAACPDIVKYYVASQLRVIWEWSNLESTKIWRDMEERLVTGSIAAQPWLAQDKRHSNSYLDTPLRTTFKNWDRAAKIYDLTSFPSPFLPLWNNPDFIPGMTPKTFHRWVEGGCILGRDMFTLKGNCKSFDQCKIDFKLTDIEKHRYLQIRHWLETPHVLKGLTRKLTRFEEMISKKDCDKGLISDIYKVLLEARVPSLWNYQKKWEEELGKTFTEKQWEAIWKRQAKSSINARLIECNYKLLVRWHMAPTHLKAIDPKLSDGCWRVGCKQKGTFLHMWWDCEKVKTFWKEIAGIIGKIIGMEFPWDPGLMLLNMPLGLTYPLFSPRGRLITNLLSAAKGLVARYWKFAENLNRELWLIRVWDIIVMDKITSNMSDMEERFQKTWAPFVDFALENAWADLCPRHLRTMMNMYII